MDYARSKCKNFIMIYCSNPFFQYLSYDKEIQKSIIRVLNSKQYVLGNEVSSFENEFAKFIGTKYSIGVANGTDAIEIGLRSLGIGNGDEVITVSHTANATVSAIESTGANPVLIDIEEDYFTINPDKISKAINKNTKAVICVHLYGQSIDLDKVKSICKKKNIYLIEDVSQAHGALWNGKRLGSFGIFATFSCYPTKNLGAIGDAGIITTNKKFLEKKIKMIREYGWVKKFDSNCFGRNSRLDEIQAAILRIKLKKLDRDNEKRQKIADFYSKNLDKNLLKTPKIKKNSTHVFHQYVCISYNRNKLMSYLKKNGIYAGIHYPRPVHLQPFYLNKYKNKNLAITEKISNKIISLPIYPELKISEVKKIVNIINKF